MKGIILRQDEVKQLQAEGAVTVWRDVKPPLPRPGEFLHSPAPDRAFWQEAENKWWFVPGDVAEHDPSPHTLYEYKSPAVVGEVRFVQETLWISECGKYYALRPHFTGYEANKMLVAAIEQKTLVVATGYTLESAYGQKWRFTLRFDQHQATFCNKKPSTTMPEWASRYRVVCKSVTVEKRGEVWQWGIELEKVTQ